MATGLINATAASRNLTVRLVDAATANNSPPSGASAGVALNDLIAGTFGAFTPIDAATILVYSTAGSGTMVVTIRLWGYSALAAQWFPLGVGTDAAKGTINAGVALGETAANTIQHAEPVYFPGHFDRVYAEILAIGGTLTAITVDLVFGRSAV